MFETLVRPTPSGSRGRPHREGPYRPVRSGHPVALARSAGEDADRSREVAQTRARHRAEVGGIAEREDAAVVGHHPVPLAGGRGGDAGDGPPGPSVRSRHIERVRLRAGSPWIPLFGLVTHAGGRLLPGTLTAQRRFAWPSAWPQTRACGGPSQAVVNSQMFPVCAFPEPAGAPKAPEMTPISRPEVDL
jgi:hypothetical protein